MYQNKTLTCRDCGAEFTFTANEQEFYADKGFENEPSRCPDCRAARKRQRNNGRGNFNHRPREMFKTTCSKCGKVAEVPFRPLPDKPVYCKECYQANKSH
jgi:CxxC-x17-CxxC domain-containing protein